ncbi:MAG: CoA-binding protein [Bacteriovoracaceae bacterium]|nr:CoA-binding protein [Bacteriovoracaceae bacterium]
MSFIHESKVYNLLKENGVGTPLFGTLNPECTEADIDALPFKEGERVVVKGLAKDLWHKSDEGALKFIEFSKSNMMETHKEIMMNLKGKYEYIETLVCAMVPFKTTSNLPSEGFVSINRDDSSGTIINFGIGGIHTEAWALELKSKILQWPIAVMTPERAFEELKNHWIGRVWLGTLRQGKELATEETLFSFVKGLWEVAKVVEKECLDLLEMNPVVLDGQGVPMAIDGVGVQGKEVVVPAKGNINPEQVLRPKTVAIAGVSDKPGNFGGLILNNLINSKLGIENLTVIKPKATEFRGVKAVNDVSHLLDNPVDALLLALPAPITVATLEQLCKQGGGADLVYIVAGGIGDGADKDHLVDKVKGMLSERRAKGEWTPTLIGPNSLGVVLSELDLSTLFISRERLPITFSPKGNISFVSQSGAFFITRISTMESLPIKYAHCIGNQIDMKVSDFVDVYKEDSNIDVIATYVEGFDTHECVRLAEKAKEAIAKGKHVVLYKGGRSTEGQEAAAGHTGSMAGNYDLQKKVLTEAGIIICESFADYSSVLKWLSAYPKHTNINSVGVMSNAGYETVGTADHLGEDKITGRANLLKRMTGSDHEKLSALIEKNGLKGLVGSANPFDITPSAGREMYLDGARFFAETEADAVIVSVIPLTEKLNPFSKEEVTLFCTELKSISSENDHRPIAVVVDCGSIYNEYCQWVEAEGIPVFRSIERPFSAIRIIKQ